MTRYAAASALPVFQPGVIIPIAHLPHRRHHEDSNRSMWCSGVVRVRKCGNIASRQCNYPRKSALPKRPTGGRDASRCLPGPDPDLAEERRVVSQNHKLSLDSGTQVIRLHTLSDCTEPSERSGSFSDRH